MSSCGMGLVTRCWSGMDPRIKPEDDERERLGGRPSSCGCRLCAIFLNLVILGLDPRNHAMTVTEVLAVKASPKKKPAPE